MKPKHPNLPVCAPDVFAVGLPVNDEGYVEDLFFTVNQFMVEYCVTPDEFTAVLAQCDFPLVMYGNAVLVAKSDADRWFAQRELYEKLAETKILKRKTKRGGK